MDSNFKSEIEYRARCAVAINSLRLFIQDAKTQLKTSIPLSTLEMIVDTVDEKPKNAIYYDNCNEVAYTGGRR